MTRTPEGHSQAVGDVPERKILEADELERLPLLVWQLSEAGKNEPATFVVGEEAWPSVRAGVEPNARVDAELPCLKRIHFLERIAAVCDSATKRRLAPQRPVIGVLQQPDFYRSSRRIVEVGLSIYLQKHVLGDVFRFGGVAKDIGGNPVHEPCVAADQVFEGVSVAGLHGGHEFRISLGSPAVDLHRWYPLSMDLRYTNTYYRWFTNPGGCGTQPRVPRRKAISQKNRPRPAVLRPLGAQLRRLRLDRKWSQEYLAERASLNYKYLGRIELGKADPGADVLVRLARALTVPVGELFETITPAESVPNRLSPSDIENLSTALSVLQATVDRVVGRQPRPTSGPARARAPRRRR